MALGSGSGLGSGFRNKHHSDAFTSLFTLALGSVLGSGVRARANPEATELGLGLGLER